MKDKIYCQDKLVTQNWTLASLEKSQLDIGLLWLTRLLQIIIIDKIMEVYEK